MNKALLIIATLFSLNLSANPQVAQCEACHGANGVSSNPNVPTIAGLSVNYMLDSFAAYQQQDRQSAVKQAMLSKLTQPQLDQLATHYAGQTYAKGQQAFDAKLAGQGKQVHNMQCAICHDAAGTVAEDDAGFLSGQWQPYLKQVIDEYRSGKRLGSKKMIEKMQQLSDAQVEQLLHYYASGKE